MVFFILLFLIQLVELSDDDPVLLDECLQQGDLRNLFRLELQACADKHLWYRNREDVI